MGGGMMPALSADIVAVHATTGMVCATLVVWYHTSGFEPSNSSVT